MICFSYGMNFPRISFLTIQKATGYIRPLLYLIVLLGFKKPLHGLQNIFEDGL